MKKKLITTLIIAGMLFTAPTQMVYATEESQPSSWAQEEVTEAIERGYVPEDLQERYQEPITRQEFVDIYVETVFTEVHNQYERYSYFQKKESFKLDDRGMTPEVFMEKIETTWAFADTDNLNARVAQVLGVTNGDENKNFNPNDNITREQVAVLLMNGAQVGSHYSGQTADTFMTDMNTVSDWAYDAVNLAVSARHLKGNSATTFNPKGTVTIEQAILMCFRIISTDGHRRAPFSLRGYNFVVPELLENYSIDGNTIYVKSTGYDPRCSQLKLEYKRSTWGKDLAANYTAEQLLAHIENPVGGSWMLWEDVVDVKNGTEILSDDNRRARRCLDGKYQKHVYGNAFIVEHNVDGYLSIIKKQEGFNYYLGSSAGLIYIDGNNKMQDIYLTEVIE